ncbi:MAG: glycosyl transferase group 1, partial [Frankiales bacterium]|nr:glycosyl transferase group 1 [Frankiales bacterium]
MLRRVLEVLVQEWDVTLLASEPAVAARLAEGLPLRTVLLPPVPHKGHLRGALAHLRAVRACRPDVVLVNLRQPYAAQYLLAGALLARLPVVAVEHLPVTSRSGLQRRLKRWTSARLSAHLCVGQEAGKRVEADAALPPGSVAAVRNGVAWVEAAPLPLPEGLGRPCLTWVGRLARQKGLDVVLHALVQLPGVSLWIDGEGEERAALEAQTAALGLTDRVRFTGWGPDPRGVLASADVVVVASRQEAWSLALVEALQAGRPLVVSALPENLEVVGCAASSFPVDDVDALVAALRPLLDDPALRQERAGAALARARELPSPQDMVASYALV